MVEEVVSPTSATLSSGPVITGLPPLDVTQLGSDQMLLKWVVSNDTLWSQKYITFSMYMKTTGWMGIGFGATNMINADIVFMSIQPGSPPVVTLGDMWSTAFSIPNADVTVGGTNDVFLVSAVEANGVTAVRFYRRIDTGDTRDHVITNTGTMDCIFAFHPSSDVPTYHGPNNRITKPVDFANTKELRIRTFIDRSTIYYIHGAGMLAIWGVVVPFSIFVSRYLKAYSGWVATHRSLMTLASSATVPLVLTAINAKDGTLLTTHSQVGLVIGGLVVFNVLYGHATLLALHSLRNVTYMRLAKLLHVLLGWTLFILAMTQLQSGFDLLNPNWTPYYYLWLAFFLSFFIAGEIFHRRDRFGLFCRCRRSTGGWFEPADELENSYQLSNTALLRKTLPCLTVQEVQREVMRGASWIIVEDRVFDIQLYMDEHPGGRAALQSALGTDAGRYFFGVQTMPIEGMKPHQHSFAAMQRLQTMCIGIVAAPIWPAAVRLSVDNTSKKGMSTASAYDTIAAAAAAGSAGDERGGSGGAGGVISTADSSSINRDFGTLLRVSSFVAINPKLSTLYCLVSREQLTFSSKPVWRVVFEPIADAHDGGYGAGSMAASPRRGFGMKNDEENDGGDGDQDLQFAASADAAAARARDPVDVFLDVDNQDQKLENNASFLRKPKHHQSKQMEMQRIGSPRGGADKTNTSSGAGVDPSNDSNDKDSDSDKDSDDNNDKVGLASTADDQAVFWADWCRSPLLDGETVETFSFGKHRRVVTKIQGRRVCRYFTVVRTQLPANRRVYTGSVVGQALSRSSASPSSDSVGLNKDGDGDIGDSKHLTGTTSHKPSLKTQNILLDVTPSTQLTLYVRSYPGGVMSTFMESCSRTNVFHVRPPSGEGIPSFHLLGTHIGVICAGVGILSCVDLIRFLAQEHINADAAEDRDTLRSAASAALSSSSSSSPATGLRNRLHQQNSKEKQRPNDGSVRHRPATLSVVCSFETEEDILARDWLEQLAATCSSWFQLSISVQKPSSASWNGRTGRFSRKLIAHFLPRSITSSVFVCGSANFNSQIQDLLMSMQYNPARISLL